jgi:1-acyl-sn-glycerol-3-phosphate acyltransferase
MSRAVAIARELWMGYWRGMRRYHRFEVRGLQHILGSGPAMIVGYHGQPGARDLIMLQELLLREHGETTYAVTHDAVFRIPLLRDLAEGMELVSRERGAIADIIERGEKLIVAPGGIREAWSTVRDRYRLRWRQSGYLKLALRHGLPIIPVVGAGAGDAFYSAYDAYRFWKPIWKRTGLPEGFGLYLGIGPCGLWPFSPPFPARIVQYAGAPIDLIAEFGEHGKIDPDDRAALDRINQQIAARMQDMLDRARAELRGRHHGPEFEELTWVDDLRA